MILFMTTEHIEHIDIIDIIYSTLDIGEDWETKENNTNMQCWFIFPI